MFNFFAEQDARQGDYFYISGSDYNHIRNVLRMKTGEEFLVSCDGISSLCRLEGFEGDSAVAEIIEEKDLSGEMLINTVSRLIENKPRLSSMSEAARRTAIIDANERIYQALMQLYTNA